MANNSTSKIKTSKNKSISNYKLRQVDFENNETGQNQIVTVNFYQKFKDLNYRKSNSEYLKEYFESYSKYLQQVFEFAKKIKIEEGKTFKAESSVGFSNYLEENYGINVKFGAEFEIFTTKVEEAIKSIEKNPYIVDLGNKIRIKLFCKARNLDENEIYKKENSKLKKVAEKYLVNLDEILLLIPDELFAVFNYELFTLTHNLIKVLGAAKIFEKSDYNIKENLIHILNDFNQEGLDYFNKQIIDAKNYIKNNSNTFRNGDIVDTFVNYFYFGFDPKIREIEDQYLPEINLLLNKVIQTLGESNSNLTNGIENKLLNQGIFSINFLNFASLNQNELLTSLDTIYSKIETYYKLKVELNELNEKKSEQEDMKTKDYEKIENDLEEIENFFNQNIKDEFLKGVKAKNNKITRWFLSHPKSAPSYPNKTDIVNIWNKEKAFSNTFLDKKEFVNSLFLVDYLLIRCCKLIQNNEYYKIYQYLNIDSEIQEAEEEKKKKLFLSILKFYLSNYDKNYQFDLINHDSDRINKLLNDEVLQITPKKVNGTKKTQKSRKFLKYEIFTYSQNYKFNTIQFEIDNEENNQIETLIKFLSTKFNNLIKNNIEFEILKQIINEVDRGWIDSWMEIVYGRTEKNLKKLDSKTELRREALNKIHGLPVINKDKIFNIILSFFIDLETKLRLNTSHENYKVVNKILFKKYQNLVQFGLECLDLKSENFSKLEEKSYFTKLLLDKKNSISLKVNRMTKRTSGNSTLLFEVKYDNTLNKIKKTNNAFLACYAIKKSSLGFDYKILDNFKDAQKILENDQKKSVENQIWDKICVGFLNGDKDNKSDIKVNYVYKNGQIQTSGKMPKDESEIEDLKKKGIKLLENGEIPKYYRTYENWQILDGETIVEDSYRGNLENVGGTSPAGYPKLYYFLIPKNCINLIVPVQTHSYYLNKYTPYNFINEYIDLEKDGKIKELLELRTKIRSKSGISSFELIINKKIEPSNNSFVNVYEAEGHIQFSNPVKTYLDEENKEIKSYNLEEFQEKFESILSIDLGEKHLAVCNLQKIKEKSKNNNFYLPLRTNIFNEIIEHDLNSEKKIFINPEEDKFYKYFDNIRHSYKNQQKNLGTVKNNLRNKKIYFTDFTIEQIASQIVKIAKKHKSYVVFENLETGLSSKKLELTTMTAIQKETYAQLCKVGLALNYDYYINKDNYDKIGTGVFIEKDGSKNYTLNGCSKVNPYMTSLECYRCSYKPILTKNQSKAKNIYVTIDFDNWFDTGVIDVFYNKENSDELFLQIIDEQKEVKIISKSDNQDIINKHFESVLRNIGYFKTNDSTEKFTVIEYLKKELYKNDSRKERLNKSNLENVFVKYILKTRQSQSNFFCPYCGYNANADYNASNVIGKRFLNLLN
jgi:hypothetical protein